MAVWARYLFRSINSLASITIVISLIFLVQQTTLFRKQTKGSGETARAENHVHLREAMFKMNEVFLLKPENRKYFYDSVPFDRKSSDYPFAETVTELLLVKSSATSQAAFYFQRSDRFVWHSPVNSVRPCYLSLRQPQPSWGQDTTVETEKTRCDEVSFPEQEGVFMSIHQTASIEEQMPWRDFHHIALATADLDATRSFYMDTLGIPVSAIFPPREGRGRHCLIYVKLNDSETWGFHFFERPEVARRAMSLVVGEQANFLLHIALRLLHDLAAHALRERLHKAQVSVTDIPEWGSFVFNDNNGILLEVIWPKAEAD